MKIYNSRTRLKEELVPIEGKKLGIYVCGPTVYDYFHIGNARAFILFDVLRQYLQYEGYDVTYVQNFTDIDDKMIRRANEEGVTVKELAEKYITAYQEDAQALGIMPAGVHPRATQHIPHMLSLIQTLMDKGKAYASGGDVYFRVRSFPAYGQLSGQDMEELEEGASDRSIMEADKEDPRDFVLWKAQKEGEPAWNSPWGPGRPGWHIECSAMAMAYIGETVDIHCGGKDLLFPHHENELAQSEGATGKPFVRYWMHNGFINTGNEKMSKSEGNFFTVRDIFREFNPETVRMFILSAHYRNPVSFSREQLQQAQASLSRLYGARDHLLYLLDHTQDRVENETEKAFIARLEDYKNRFKSSMSDDLNTADALGVMFEMAKDFNIVLHHQSAKAIVNGALRAFTDLCGVLGLLIRKQDDLPAHITELAARRVQAREQKNWSLSDSLRDEITAQGYVVEDTPAGQKVRKPARNGPASHAE